MYRLIADDHAVLVGAHLGAPDPEWPAKQNGGGLSDLRNGDVGASEQFAIVVRLAWEEFHYLGLVALAIAVLAEQHTAGRGGTWQGYDGVTHIGLTQLLLRAGTMRPRHSPKPIVTAPARRQWPRKMTSSPSSR